MVPPSAMYFQKAARQAFPDESAFLREGDGSVIGRLDIGFQAVEFELPEGVFQHQKHSLAHQALAGIRRKGVITERRALESSANHVVDIDDAGKVTRTAMDHQESVMAVRGIAMQIIVKFLAGFCLRRNP